VGAKTSWIAGVALVLATVAAHGQEDLYQQAKAALTQGRTEDARQLYCSLAASSANYKNARAMCTMLQTKGAQGGDYDSFYELGVRQFNEGNYDEAAEAFQKVRGGSHRDDAKDYLLYRLPQARLKAAEAAAQPPAPAPAPPPPPANTPAAAAATHPPAGRHPAAIEKKAGSAATAASSNTLADALTEYYAGQFTRAETDLQEYLQQNPKNSLAQFYLGVCRLTRYYIAPEKARPPELLAQAQAAFRTVKQSEGFVPPEKYVAPKIMQVYAATTP
jgi:outer membrane protein assembly factor BamD (BamD/ComL family)